MALAFQGKAMAALIALGDDAMAAAVHMLKELLPLSTCKATPARALFCIFIEQLLTQLDNNVREVVTETNFDELLPTMLQLTTDNTASVRVAALFALKPWCGEELELVSFVSQGSMILSQLGPS